MIGSDSNQGRGSCQIVKFVGHGKGSIEAAIQDSVDQAAKTFKIHSVKVKSITVDFGTAGNETIYNVTTELAVD